jgi:hypothetical protein
LGTERKSSFLKECIMSKKIDINDTEAWRSLNWDDPVTPDALKKTDATVNRSRSAFFKKENKEFAETMSEVAKERNQKDDYKKNHSIGVNVKRDNTYQAEVNARPEVKAKISKSLTNKSKSTLHKENLKKVTTNKPGNKNWEKACAEGRNKRDKPFKCPFGVFNNRSEAARYAKENNLFTNAQRKLEGWTKEKPDEYYFITHEEYAKLKKD